MNEVFEMKKTGTQEIEAFVAAGKSGEGVQVQIKGTTGDIGILLAELVVSTLCRVKVPEFIDREKFVENFMELVSAETKKRLSAGESAKEAESTVSNKRDTSFEVGDKVRIRQWDDMAKQFGVDRCGDIKAKGSFTKAMKCLCGKELTIKELSKFPGWKDGVRVLPSESVGGFIISTDMIEKIDSKKESSEGKDELLEMLKELNAELESIFKEEN